VSIDYNEWIMRIEKSFITQTVQSCSCACLNKTDKDSIINPEAEDNMSLLLSLFDNLNELCVKLSRLSYLMQRKIIENSLYCNKEKGEKK